MRSFTGHGFLRGVLELDAAKAAQRARTSAPTYAGDFPAPDGRVGRYDVTPAGLTLAFEGAPACRSITDTASHGGLRQVLVPNQWDGRHMVVVMAGAASYAASYAGLIAHLLSGAGARRPVAVAWEDVPGYGYSAADRRFADVRHIDELVDPQIAFLEAAPTFFKERPAVVPVGFSLGGQVALYAASRRPDLVAGVVALAPLLRVGGVFGAWWFRALLRVAARVPRVSDRYIHRARFRRGQRSRDAAWYTEDYVRRLEDDPFLDDSALLRSLHAVTAGGDALLDTRPPPLRVRFLHSVGDRTCRYDATARLAARWRALGGDVRLQPCEASLPEEPARPGLPGEAPDAPRSPHPPHQLLQLRAPACYAVYAALDRLLLEIWT